MVTVSRVRPICSRKEIPCTEPLELVRLWVLKLPLDSRPDSPDCGLEDKEGVGGAAAWDTDGESFCTDGGEDSFDDI